MQGRSQGIIFFLQLSVVRLTGYKYQSSSDSAKTLVTMATATAVDVSLNREGYPVEIFKNHLSVDEKFLCNICHKIIRDPVQSLCGHRFCKSCVYRISSSGDVERCQKCEAEGADEEYNILKMDQMFPDNAVRREMSKLPVTCIYEGCSWTGNFRGYEHDNECPKATLVCPAGCNKQLLKSELEKHLKEKHRDWQAGLNLNLINLANMNIPHMMERLENRVSQISNTDVVQQVVNEAFGATIRQTVEMHQNTFQSMVETLYQNISQLTIGFNSHEQQCMTQKEETNKLNSQLKSLERSLGLKGTNIAEHELRFQALESTTYDGTFIFRINNFTKMLHDARTGSCISVYSAPFYTSRHGYKMCIRLYPNGDGMGKGSHLSLFFVVMRSHFDALLRWPFQQRVTFCLINQSGGEHMIDSFRPDPNSSSFRRPTSDMNIASGCPLFIRHEVLCNPENGYLKDETLFVRVVVDTSNIPDPLSTLDERIKR